jgi:purine nucleosidase
LRVDPSIKRNISRIFVMGGAVRTAGNVEQKGHDGSAEWNFYNEPRAAADVIQSGIPVTLIALDATNHVPLTNRFVEQLAAQPSIASQLAAQAWKIALPSDGSFQYYFWDTLTAAALLDPGVVTLQTMRIRVVTDGPSQGRTIEDPNGASVEVAVGASQQRVEKMFLDILGRE